MSKINKFTRKYLKIAKAIADDNTSCYARKIGVLIISENNTPISFGYNGSIRKSPHTDSAEYLTHLYNDLLTQEDKIKINASNCNDFVAQYTGCKTCPRRILGIPSGQRLELCNCAHAERNALANANASGATTKNATIYCWCGVPCHECTIQIIQAQLKKIVCLKKDHDYSDSSRWLLESAGVELEIFDENDVLADIR